MNKSKNKILEEDIEYIFSKIRNKGNWDGAIILITGCGGFLGFYFMHLFNQKLIVKFMTLRVL